MVYPEKVVPLHVGYVTHLSLDIRYDSNDT